MLILYFIGLLSEIFRNLILLLNHIDMQLAFQLLVMQGVVTFIRPVELFATRIKIFDLCLDCMIALKKGPVIV